MVITKDKGKQTFTITGVTLGMLLALQRAFRIQLNTTSLTPVGEDILLEVNRAIEKESKKES